MRQHHALRQPSSAAAVRQKRHGVIGIDGRWRRKRGAIICHERRHGNDAGGGGVRFVASDDDEMMA